jgi:hypothetical protein
MSFHTADTLESKTVTTGSEHLDKLLGGGLEVGLMHLFYGDKILREDILRIAVSAQLPESRGGLDGSTLYNRIHPNNDVIITFLRCRGYTVINLIEVRKSLPGEDLIQKVKVDCDEFDY